MNMRAALLEHMCVTEGLMSDMSNPKWRVLASYVNQDELNDAFSKHDEVRRLYASKVGCGLLTSRPGKHMNRVTQKAETHPVPFKVICDFIAFRVPCEVAYIPTAVQQILTSVPCDASTTKHSPIPDIVQYVYVYQIAIGHVIEFQVGHPFAAYTFKIDSRLRDDPACGEIDLWKDGVYLRVRKYILNKSNGIVISGEKHDVWDAVYGLHSGNIPVELRNIMNDID